MKPAKVREIFTRLQAHNPNPTTELAYSTPFELLIAVILSAQASDVGVNKATRALFAAAPTPAAMVALGLHALQHRGQEAAGIAVADGSQIVVFKDLGLVSQVFDEQTLSSLAAVVNGGGLGQIGDIIHNFNTAITGRQGDIRELITRLDDFIGVLDQQRDNIVSSIQSLNRLSATFANQRDVLSRALTDMPAALDVLIQERPRLTTALQKLGTFSETANTVVTTSKDDLVANLNNLGPALKALADVGPRLDEVLEFAAHLPFTQSFIDRAVRGDYMNLFAYIDLSIPKLKKTLMLGTRWAQEDAVLVPTPGEPGFLAYTYDPLKTGANPAPPGAFPPVPQAADAAPLPVSAEPVLPVVPPAPLSIPGGPVRVDAPAPAPGTSGPVFAGPYGAQADPVPPPAAPPTGGGG